MYIQITNRCNMTCGHCGFACTRTGTDMDESTLKAALRLCENLDSQSYVTIGGGEPTLHPRFWEFFGLILGLSGCDMINAGIHIVTNGTVRRTALRLADLARSGLIGATLSRTRWHATQVIQPDEDVIRAFESASRYDRGSRDYRSINGDAGKPVAAGRAGEWGSDGCLCDDLVIDPEGRIWECGCRLVEFGTVFDPQIPDSYWEWEEERCSRETQDMDSAAA